MSAAAAAPVETPKPGIKGKKKLIIIAVATLVLAIAAAAAVLVFKQSAAKKRAAAQIEAEAQDDEEGEDGKRRAKKSHSAAAPTFIPLDPFVVNLADRDTDRFAQIGVTLEVDDPKVAESLKQYMPAIRNGILMVLSHKTSTQLLERAGKEALADEIMREASLPLADSDAEKKKREKAKESGEPPPDPIARVLFSSFIIQ